MDGGKGPGRGTRRNRGRKWVGMNDKILGMTKICTYLFKKSFHSRESQTCQRYIFIKSSLSLSNWSQIVYLFILPDRLLD